MIHSVATTLAAVEPLQAGRPLFGNLGLALTAVSVAIAALLAGVAMLGRWLAATHPAPPAPAVVLSEVVAAPVVLASPRISGDVAAEVVPVILAAVTHALGAGARVTEIRPAPGAPIRMPSIEALMREWSHEGRRQIYSSHKVR